MWEEMQTDWEAFALEANRATERFGASRQTELPSAEEEVPR